MKNRLLTFFVLAVFYLLYNTAACLAEDWSSYGEPDCSVTPASCHYIRDGGSGDGSAWNNAWDDLPTTFVRGHKYYVADGTYGSHSFDTAENGAAYIFIKKATETDHGTSTGWSSSYGDGQALFTANSRTWIVNRTSGNYGYWIFDGQTGGGPGSWKTGHGIKIKATTSTSAGEVFCIGPGAAGSNQGVDHVKVFHLEIEGPSYSGGVSHDGVFIAGSGENKYFHLAYNYIHNTPRVNVLTRSTVYLVAEYNCFSQPGSSAEVHGEIWSHENTSDHSLGDNMIFRYNLLENTTGSGAIFLKKNNAPSNHSWIYVYGNVFVADESWNGSPSQGSFGMSNEASSSSTDSVFYNNSIINVYQYSASACESTMYMLSGGARNTGRNNLFWESCISSGGWSGVATYTHNWYGAIRRKQQTGDYTTNIVSDEGATAQNGGSSSPFVNWTGGNYGLTGATDAGYSLSNPSLSWLSTLGAESIRYDIDMLGNTRGADGTWDRGALEYTGTDTTAPTVSGTPSIGTDGQTFTTIFSESMVTTGYDNGDWNLDCTTAGTDIALNSISGTGATRTFTLASIVYSGDTCNLDATHGADEMEDLSGNDLATFSDAAVTNNSTQTTATPGTLDSATISADGETLTLAFDEAMWQSTAYSDDHWDIDCTSQGNNIGITYSSGNGTASHVYIIDEKISGYDTCDIDFTGTADSMVDAEDNDLAAIVSDSVTNTSDAQAIYIDASYSGTESGTKQEPYNAFSDINWSTGGSNSITDWVSASDDVFIRLKKGETWSTLFTVGASGVSGHPITINSYGTGNAPEIDTNAASNAMIIDSKSYITVDGISFTDANGAAVIVRNDTDNVTIQNCIFHDLTKGIYTKSQNAYDVHDISYLDNDIDDISDKAFEFQIAGEGDSSGSDDGTMYNITVDGNNFDTVLRAIQFWGDQTDVAPVAGTEVQPYDLTITDNIVNLSDQAAIAIGCGLRTNNGSIIARNYLTNIGDGVELYTNAIQLGGVEDLIVEENYIKTVTAVSNDGAGIVLDFAWSDTDYLSNGVIVRRNWVEDCNSTQGKGIWTLYSVNADIYANVVVNCKRGLQHASSVSTGNEYYNNTVVGSSQYGFLINVTAAQATFKNNIIVNSGIYGIYLNTGTAPIEDWNNVYNSTTANFQGITKGANSKEENPRFTDLSGGDYTLTDISPDVDSGVDLGATFDNALLAGSEWADNVLYDDQDNYGDGWEKGAYIFDPFVESISGIQGVTIN